MFAIWRSLFLVAIGVMGLISSPIPAVADSESTVAPLQVVPSPKYLDRCNSSVSAATSRYAQCLSKQLRDVLTNGEPVSGEKCSPKFARRVERLRKRFVDRRGVDNRACGLDSDSIRATAAGVVRVLRYNTRSQRVAVSMSVAPTPRISQAAEVCALAEGTWDSDTLTCSGVPYPSHGFEVCEILGGTWYDEGGVCSEPSRCKTLGLCGPCGYGPDHIPNVQCTEATLSDFGCLALYADTAEWQAGVTEFQAQRNALEWACGDGYQGFWNTGSDGCLTHLYTSSIASDICEQLLPNYDGASPQPSPTPLALTPGSWSATCDQVSWDGATLCAVCATATSSTRDSYSCASCPGDYENLLGILSCGS